MTRNLRPVPLLRQAIDVAHKIELAASQKMLRTPLQTVGYGHLVRNRRLAIAVARLGKRSAYEARLLVRTMLEIQINYAWMRLRNRHSRALRFLRFPPIERLKLLEKTATIFRPTDYKQTKKRLEAERRKVRHLFRFRDSNNKMRWAMSWASVSSVEARLTEIQKKENPVAQPDTFLYGMYISFSSATHGSPISLGEVLRVGGRRLVPAPQPEPRPLGHMVGAFVILSWTIDAFAEDSKLKRPLRQELSSLSSALNELRKRRKPDPGG